MKTTPDCLFSEKIRLVNCDFCWSILENNLKINVQFEGSTP
jgi:hypothetical protein